MKKFLINFLNIITLVLLLSACGLKGDLTLPETTQTNNNYNDEADQPE